MTCQKWHAIQFTQEIFYGFLSSTKNMGKNIGKNTTISLNSKYSQKRLDHAKQSATDAFKTSS